MGSRDEYVDVIKSSFVSIGSKAVHSGLVTAFPSAAALLANPFTRFVIDFFIKKLLNFLAKESEMAVFFKYIDMRVGVQAKEFEAAAYANHAAQLTGDKDAIKKAENDLWAKFEPFARLTV